jgi:hypothetical protein
MSGAKFWPAKLPAHVRSEELRQSEVRVYDLLTQKLDPGWIVFYSRPWLGLTPTGGEKDGECDFVVVHPDHGYLAIEVKGGEITYDAALDQWQSKDRYGTRRKIKNPIAQAKSSKHELLKQVKNSPHWPKGRFIRMRHGVIFTHTVAPPKQLGTDAPRELFCCRDELELIDIWISKRLSGGEEEPIGTDGVKAFEEVLAAPFHLKVPLGHYLDDDEQAINTLTPQQFNILNSVGHLPRVAVGGGAGTGKTIVAIEDSVRLAQSGRKTAFVCVSKNLATHVARKLAEANADVSVFDLQQLCAHVAGSRAPSGNLETGIEQILHAEKSASAPKFDAIIVDEAQDFRSHWWVAIDALLTDPRTSMLHAYYDVNQSVYGDLARELQGFHFIPVFLTLNLRNTKNIHNAASQFYKGMPILASGPEGSNISWKPCQDSQIPQSVAHAAHHLVNHERVDPSDIVVLNVSPSLVTAFAGRNNLPAGVEVEDVRDFKGLERKVVILAATREIADEREMAYVALSRARVHLIVVGEKPILDWLEQV